MFGLFRKNTCDRVKELLSEYLDQRLDPKENTQTENHLETCESCRKDYDSLRDTVTLLSRVPSVAIPRSFAITEAQPLPYPSFFGTLRTATIALAAMLVLLFTGDVTNVLPGALPEPTQSTMSETSSPFPPGDDVMIEVSTEGVATPDGNLTGGEVIPPLKAGQEGPAPEGVQIEEKLPGPSEVVLGTPSPVSETSTGRLWWLRPLELSLLAVVVVMGGITLSIWRRHKMLCRVDK